jgi:hypothetical protein
MRKLLIISLLLFPVVTLASGGAWCLVLDETENCRYGTAEACYSNAAKIGGYCRENARALGSRGDRQWCVVSASGRNCNYIGQRRCHNIARRLNGGCVENTEALLKNKRRGMKKWDYDGDVLAAELNNALQEESAAAAQESQQPAIELDEDSEL